MKILDFAPDKHAATWARQGWLKIEDAVDPEFLSQAERKIQAMRDQQKRGMQEFAFKNKKEQYLYEFTEDEDLDGLYDDISRLTGIDRKKITLCERHVKIYEDNAEPNPVPHKDRLASEVVLGIPILLSSDSYLVLFPTVYRETNPFQSTAEWRSRLSKNEDPAVLLNSIEPTKVHCKRGDIFLFNGAGTFHERINPAGAILLFLKFNGLRMDPIGEDPRTIAEENQSREILGALRRDGDLLGFEVEVSPRLENVDRYYSRLEWREVLAGKLWSKPPFPLTELEFDLLRKIHYRMPVRKVLEHFAASNDKPLASLRALGEKGGVNFLKPRAGAANGE
jgi:hypothetical protein